MSQSLSSGFTLLQKQSLTWAFSGAVPNNEPLSGTTGILKYGGRGGSYFTQSIPNSLTFNLDHTPAVHNPLRTMMWPLILNNTALEMNPEHPGNLSKAIPIKLTAEKLFEKVSLLVDMAEKNLPRPGVIIVDTVETLLSLIESFIATRFKKDDFLDLGEAGWVRRAQTFWDAFYWPLKHAGYSIVLVIQLYDEPKDVLAPDGRSRVSKVYPNTSLVSDKFFKRLRDACNIVAKIETTEETSVDIVAGKPVSQKTQKWHMIFRDPVLGDLVKSRENIPDRIDITGLDPYAKFAAAIIKSQSSKPT